MVKLHNALDFNHMRIAGRLAADLLDYIEFFVVPGVTTNELNELCHLFTLKRGGESAPLGYHGFPKSVCTSVNNSICHQIPDDTVLKDGDIINIDVTPTVNGWHGDSSRTFLVGDVKQEIKDLVEATKAAMMFGIQMAMPGNYIGDIGWAIQNFAEQNGYSVVKEFGGHGIGKIFHDSPSVPNFGIQGKGMIIREGMFFTVEPMLNLGTAKIKMLNDGWTVVTEDGLPSAQFEHTIGITKDGCEIFTLSSKDDINRKVTNQIA